MTKRKPGSMTPPRRFWTPAEIEKMQREYPDRETADLAAEFECSEARVYAKAAELGLHKSDAYMESDRSGRIQRGRQDPRMVATQFKPGQKSWNRGSQGNLWHASQLPSNAVQERRNEWRGPAQLRAYRQLSIE